MPGQTVVLLLLLVVFLLCTGPQSAQHVHLGGAVNLFSRYGYLSISMRVVPRNDTDTTWIFREPTVDVFRNTTLQREPLVVQPSNSGVFQGDFHLEFCDNMKQLLQAYFREFSFERLDRPWRGFSASWSRTALARHLGIDSSFAIGAHSYVLVRVTRHWDIGQLKPLRPDVEVEEVVAEETDKVHIGDSASVIEFIRNFGSHYIASYITGNSLYQVFVYSPTIYRRLKERLKNHGVSDLSHTELASFFSPWYAEHIGVIQAASGNTTMQAWAAENLRMNFYFFTYTSLLKLHGDGALLRTLNKLLGNEALVQLNLKMLSSVFKEPVKRQWFEEVVDNYLKLWEVNM